MSILNQRAAQLAAISAFVLCASCGGGGSESSSTTPPPPGNAVQVTMQSGQTYQTWEAWRGSTTGPIFFDQNGTAQNLASTSPALFNSILDDLVNDLGINGVRFPLHHSQNVENQGGVAMNDDVNPFHINWAGFNFSSTFQVSANEPLPINPVARMNQVVIPLRQRVLARSEPFSLYVDPIFQKSNLPAFWLAAPPAPASPGDEYAEMAQADLLWLQNLSVPPAGLTIPLVPNYWAVVNEPDTGGPNFQASDLAEMITRVGMRFAGMVGVNTKLQVVESTVPNPTMLNATLSVPGVSQYVGSVSYHGYDYNTSLKPASFSSRNQVRAAAQGLGVNTAMTEICCHTGWNGSYDHALAWARDIYWNMTEADISVWEPLSLIFTCGTLRCTGGGQSPILIDKDLSQTFKLAIYYGLRQYSKYIRPNYVRVGMSCGNCSTDATIGQNVKPVAFRSPAGKVVVVVINDQAAAQAISLLSLPAGTYEITGVDRSNAQSPVAYPSQTISAGQAVTVTFPAQSILTFVQR